MALRFIVLPVTFSPRLSAPLFAIVERATVPEAASAELVLNVSSLLTLKLLNVAPPEDRLNAPAPLLLTVAEPVVLTDKLDVDVLILPILPDVEVNAIDVDPLNVPADCVILPEPFALTVSTVPEAFAPRTIPPLVPVANKAKVPLALIEAEVVNAPAPLAESVKLILLPVDAPLPVVACESTKVTFPLVLADQLGVTIFKEPILPEVEDRAIDVVPVNVPAVWVILPEPLALIVSTVPEALAPKLILPLLAVVDIANVPVALIAPDVVNAALFDTVILFPEELPPPIFNAVPPLPAHVTFPLVLNVRLLVLPVKVDIFPEPDVRFKLVAVTDPAL